MTFGADEFLRPGKPSRPPAPFDAIPIFVRAGSIVPFGPDIQYVGEKPADPLTIFTSMPARMAISPSTKMMA